MANEKAKFETSLGDFTVEFFNDKSPATVANFVAYIKEGFMDGTIFHRVIPGFVIQGGGMLPGMKEKTSKDPVRNEATNKVPNLRGTLSMARTSDPHSASSQFFVNLSDNAALDHKSPVGSGWGYCVFAKVIEGMETVDAIAAVKTGPKPPHADVPREDVVLKKATML